MLKEGPWNRNVFKMHYKIAWCDSSLSSLLITFRNERDSVHLRYHGSRAGPLSHPGLQCREHDRVLVWHHANRQRLTNRGLALGRLLGWHRLWDVVQSPVYWPCNEERFYTRRWGYAHNEPAQQRGRETGERRTILEQQGGQRQDFTRI